MAEWQNGKPITVTPDMVKLRWGGGFWCKLCGHQFAAGDSIRFIYANGTPGAGVGNFWCCSKCDGLLRDPRDDRELIEKARLSLALATKLAKQWGIYGPDWQQSFQMTNYDRDRD